MMTDALLNFVPIGGNLSIVAGAGVSTPSNVIDLLGAGVGVAPPNIIGNVTVFGEDTGIGSDRLLIIAATGTAAFVTANAATLNVAFQGAPDNGANQPGTWQTFAETGPMTAAQLTASQKIKLDWPAAFPENERPRFVRLLFQVPAATNFTTGQIAYALATPARDDQLNKMSPNNYVVR